ncbi:receptor-type tyrosine-protein phosphatase C isoform X3 [Micropterus salmoides]|uniref:receptor-type tyrosine-protein phosphatase C isoform X3 n=1 Tax=Micropterus salmoides TaxID=27706 RepID=UPI0018EDE9EA|nr:receptor-type tyrosine-protein phosphatase C isoform X3 [Micropterus salmoides]
MAGLCGLKILLLLALIIGLANCEDPKDVSTSTPPPTTTKSSVPPKPNQSVTSSLPLTTAADVSTSTPPPTTTKSSVPPKPNQSVTSSLPLTTAADVSTSTPPPTTTKSSVPPKPNQSVTSSLPLTTAADVSTSSLPHTITKSTLPSETSQSVTSSPSRTITAATVKPTGTPAPASILSHTTPTLTSDSKFQALSSTTMPDVSSSTPPPTTTKSSVPPKPNQSVTSSLPLTTAADVSTSSLPHTITKSTFPSVTTQSVNSSPSRTITAATVKPTGTPAPALKLSPTTPTLTSDSKVQALSSTTMPATTLAANTSPASSPSTTEKSLSPTTNQTSTPITTTVSTNITATTIAPPSPHCFYTVMSIKGGFQINITSSTNGTYTINIKEKGSPEIVKKSNVQHSNQNTAHNIQDLKPCTEYKLNVAFIELNESKETPCNDAGNEITKTIGMRKDDIKEVNCTPGSVCYRSDWNISSSLSTSNHIQAEPCKSDNKTFCIIPRYNDICSDLTTTFTSGNCSKSFSLNKSIPVDFLNSKDINHIDSTRLPAEIETTFPPNCHDLTADYTCWAESGKLSELKKLPELEPYTNYRCIGQIQDVNNVTITNTTEFSFQVDCDLTINPMLNATNTSIVLSWTTTSKNCQDVHLQKLSYGCSCVPTPKQKPTMKKHTPGRTCNFTGLTPYTDYTCEVQPAYNNNDVGKPTEVPKKTAIGKPEHVTNLSVTVPEHNVIKVTCNKPNTLNGPAVEYIACLNDCSGTLKERKENCNFEFRDLSYSTTYTVKVTAVNSEFKSNPETKQVDTLYNDKAVIGFLVFLIILTSVALLLVLYKIYILKRRNSHDMSENLMLISTANDEENLMPVEPIAGEFLLEAYKRKLADEGRLFLAEFQSIPRIFSRYTVKEAKKSCNVPKNRYVDILPYDYNRVQLTTGNGEAGCDYINASFIDGYKESKKYIAAQGPKEETVGDFWRMVWEQQSSIIVMVTRCEEGNRIKCAQYWPSPERETEIYEEFIVKLSSEDHCPDYTIRHLSLTNKREKNSEREVTHIQFMSWPDHGVPGEPHLLLKLRRRVNAFKNFFSGPIVVHCSAGVGRTGTYIGIDAMMEGLEAEGRVDIYGYVVKLRRHRCLMVQVEAQYILIHQALLEHNQFGETEITLSELHSTLSTLKQKNSASEPTLMEDEFERLPTYKNWRTSNTGITEENKKKNRSSSVIPYDYNRVLLKLDEGHSRDSDPDEDDEEDSSDEEDEESTKYINASHLDGYWGPRTFIAAQTPLPDTMADFWAMVYQKKASTIVMLSDCTEGDTEPDCVYWDKDKKTFGDIEVEVESTENSPTFITRNILIRHVKRKESRPVKHFQFLKWMNREVPEKPQDLTDMIKDIKRSYGSSNSQRSVPIVVHCNDGSSRSGIFCALWTVLDSAETEKLVDVFQVTKTLRKERQGMILSKEQYQFLYDALEGVYPVQNGEVKAVQASAADSIQIVNETTEAEQLASTTSNDQQGEAESAPLVANEGKEDKKEEPEEVSNAPTETTPLEDTSNGPTVTVEV